MTKSKDKVTLSELALKFNVNKSCFRYYVDLGLLEPTGTFGKAQLFDQRKSNRIISEIFKLKNRGKELDQIKVILKKKGVV